MQVVADDRHSEIILDDYLRGSEPLVVCVEPFEGRRQVRFKLPSTEHLQMLGCSGDEGQGRARWAGELKELGRGLYFLLLFDGQSYTAFFCLSHGAVSATLVGREEDLVLQLTGEGGSAIRPVLVAASGEDLHLTVRTALFEALRAAGNLGKPLIQKAPLPEWLQRLSLVFPGTTSHGEILDGVAKLRQQGLAFGSVLIEEGWQQLEEGKLLSFEADTERFPLGLRGVMEALKQMDTEHLGVTHPLMGGPEGLAPPLAQRYRLGEELGASFQFFYDYYEQLKADGVCFVEVSRQSPLPVRGEEVYRNLHVGLQAAASIQFYATVLSRDCLQGDGLFYWTTARTAQTGARHVREHLTCSLWLQHLMQPDPGPFANHDESAALLRALCGTPLQARPTADPLTLKRLALPSGKVVRPDSAPTLTRDLLFEPTGPCKAYALATGCALIAAWNPTDQEQQVAITPSDVPLHATRFALHSDKRGYLGLIERPHLATLPPNSCDLFTLSPLLEQSALIGHPAFYLPPAAVNEWHRDEETLHISSKVAGTLLLYCRSPILEVRRNGELVPWSHDHTTHLLTIEPNASPRELPSLYTVSFE